nr:light-harvesting protein [uncultured Rhodopila sp.]
MNQGRLWTVVNPSIGLPLFLAAVAITSVIIHLALLTHTTWLPAYYNGKAHAALVVPAQTLVLPA